MKRFKKRFLEVWSESDFSRAKWYQRPVAVLLVAFAATAYGLMSDDA